MAILGGTLHWFACIGPEEEAGKIVCRSNLHITLNYILCIT